LSELDPLRAVGRRGLGPRVPPTRTAPPGTCTPSLGRHAGIVIAASPDVEVYGNLVEDNANGIIGIQQDRGAGALGPWLILNLWVYDNRVRMHVGHTGLVTDTGDMAIFRSRNNHFDRNSYFLGDAARYFTWMDDDRTEAEWRSYGQDTTGAFVRSSQPNAAVLSQTGQPLTSFGGLFTFHEGGTTAKPLSTTFSTTLLCSLTSCRNWSGASPDDGRFPVRPSSLIPSVVR
jgi:hypothetical protein